MTARVLIVDDVKADRLVLRHLLERNYYTTFEAEDGISAIEAVKAHDPDLVLLDYMMPRLDGLETCKALKANPKTAHIPVIMVTSQQCSKEKNHTLAAGADDFLTKPIDQDVLFARIKNLLRVKNLMDELQLRSETVSDFGIENIRVDDFDQTEHQLLLAASSQSEAENWRSALDPLCNFRIEVCCTEAEAFELTNSQAFDALIVSEKLAEDGIGMRLIANLRADWSNRDLAILFVAKTGTNSGLRSLEFGSNDYTLTPFDPQELATRLRTQSRRIWLAKGLRERLNRQLRLSVIDPLTELHNRRYLDDYLPKVLARAERDQIKIALMILDLDHFKTLNDQYGHNFGDSVLVEFSRRARENLRAVDMICRYGGEEFVIIVPGVTRCQTELICERLRKLVSSTPFETASGHNVTVTTSIGATMITPGEKEIKAILKRADDALYEAKDHGRNRVYFAA